MIPGLVAPGALPERIAGGYTIVEGPAWDPQAGVLYFCDGLAGGVWALGPNGARELVIPKRRSSGLALHAAGGLVASGRNVGWKHGEQSQRLLELDPAWGMAYFNDLGTSLEGRVYVGSVDYDFDHPERTPRPGYLHVIDLDGSSRIVDEGIGIANGVGVSPDGRTLYFNDTHYRSVRRYAMQANGDLKELAPLIEFAAADDQTDGIAIGADGTVWVALSVSGCVAALSPEGRELGRIPVPGHNVTSLCFGGGDLRTLYITTYYGTHDGTDGSVFKLPVQVPGMPVPLARVALNESGAAT